MDSVHVLFLFPLLTSFLLGMLDIDPGLVPPGLGPDFWYLLFSKYKENEFFHLSLIGDVNNRHTKAGAVSEAG